MNKFWCFPSVLVLAVLVFSCSEGRNQESEKVTVVEVVKQRSLQDLGFWFYELLSDTLVSDHTSDSTIKSWAHYKHNRLNELRQKPYNTGAYFAYLVRALPDSLKKNCWKESPDAGYDWEESLFTNYDSSKVAMLMIDFFSCFDDSKLGSRWKENKEVYLRELTRIQGNYRKELEERRKKWEEKKKNRH